MLSLVRTLSLKKRSDQTADAGVDSHFPDAEGQTVGGYYACAGLVSTLERLSTASQKIPPTRPLLESGDVGEASQITVQ